MKLSNRYMMLGLGCLLTTAFTACVQEGDDVGDVSDHFLNFEIPTIPCTEDYQVGVFYLNPGSNGFDATRYERLMEEPNLNTTNSVEGKAGPYLDLVLGNYEIAPDTAHLTDEMVAVMQQHVDWAIEAGVDFFILPSLQPNTNRLYPRCYAGSEQFADMLRGKNRSWKLGTDKAVDLKSLKYVLQVSMSQPLANGSAKIKDDNGVEGAATTKLDYKHPLDSCDQQVYADTLGQKRTRSELYIDFFASLVTEYGSDDRYYKVDGKPVFMMESMHEVYVSDCQAFFMKIREGVKALTGKDIFLIAKQDIWSPPARFAYFFKGVDAIYHGNMYQQGEWTRSLCYPQLIYKNWEYSHDYWLQNWDGTEFIPNTPVGFNGYVDNGRTNQPIVNIEPETFRTMCNVSKSFAGRHRLVFINSWNDVQYASFIEPTKPDYGNGMGDAMLKVVREEFKVK